MKLLKLQKRTTRSRPFPWSKCEHWQNTCGKFQNRYSLNCISTIIYSCSLVFLQSLYLVLILRVYPYIDMNRLCMSHFRFHVIIVYRLHSIDYISDCSSGLHRTLMLFLLYWCTPPITGAFPLFAHSSDSSPSIVVFMDHATESVWRKVFCLPRMVLEALQSNFPISV